MVVVVALDVVVARVVVEAVEARVVVRMVVGAAEDGLPPEHVPDVH